MREKIVQIQLGKTQETSPIALLVQEASRYESKIYLELGSKKVNAKSIMGMMSLGLDSGDEIRITAEGADEDSAIKGLEAFLGGNE